MQGTSTYRNAVTTTTTPSPGWISLTKTEIGNVAILLSILKLFEAARHQRHNAKHW